MKIPGLALASLLALAPGAVVQAQTPAAPPTSPVSSLGDTAAQDSYAIGLNLGQSLRRDDVIVDPALVARGIKDSMPGGAPLMTEDQLRAVLGELQKSVQAARQEKTARQAVANQGAGAEFLKANRAKPGVVTLPSGLQYQILTAGKGPIPTADDTVVCNYRGTLIDGTEFDSSYGRGAPLTIGVNGVIKGWTQALQLMPVGSKWRLFVPADLAYGERAAGPLIGPNATLIFEIELLSIQPKT